MELYIRSVEHRINMKKVEIMQKELNNLDTNLFNANLRLDNIKIKYDKILLKDKPVGNPIKAIRYIKNEFNYNY